MQSVCSHRPKETNSEIGFPIQSTCTPGHWYSAIVQLISVWRTERRYQQPGMLEEHPKSCTLINVIHALPQFIRREMIPVTGTRMTRTGFPRTTPHNSTSTETGTLVGLHSKTMWLWEKSQQNEDRVSEKSANRAPGKKRHVLTINFLSEHYL